MGFKKYYEEFKGLQACLSFFVFQKFFVSVFADQEKIQFLYFTKRKGIETDFYHFRTFSTNHPDRSFNMTKIEHYKDTVISMEIDQPNNLWGNEVL